MRRACVITYPDPGGLIALAERIHESVVHFKKLRESSLWSVQTFRVKDLGLFLDGERMKFVVASVGLGLGLATDAEVLSLVIHFPDDLRLGVGEIYGVAQYFGWPEDLSRSLHFVAVKRPMAEVA